MTPPIVHSNDRYLDHISLYDQILPILRGTASCARALSLAVARDAMSGADIRDGLLLVAQGLEQVLALLQQWYEGEGTAGVSPSPDDSARAKGPHAP